MLNIQTEDEELDLLEEIDDMFDSQADSIIHEMTDWVQYELDN